MQIGYISETFFEKSSILGGPWMLTIEARRLIMEP
jgi:hypothetical protein